MFVPIGDSPNPRNFRPWVTHGLIALNVAVYVLLLPQSLRRADPREPGFTDYLQTIGREHNLSRPQLLQVAQGLSEYDLTVYEHGLRPSEPTLADAFSAMFLHGGLGHLLGNMLFLWIFGDNLEHRLGRSAYLVFYLATGLGAAAGDGLIRWGSSVPSVGASGAISGVLGAYYVWFPFNRVRVWALFLPILELPARVVLGFYILVQNVLPMLFSGGAGGVSYGAHVGGFVAGAAGAWALDRGGLFRSGRSFRGATRPASRPSSSALRQALDEGRVVDAASVLFSAPGDPAVAAEDKLRLGGELLASGHERASLAVSQLVLRSHPRTVYATAAHLLASRVLMYALAQPTAAFQHLRAVLAAPVATPEQRAEASALLAELATTTRTLPRLQ